MACYSRFKAIVENPHMLQQVGNALSSHMANNQALSAQHKIADSGIQLKAERWR